MALAHDLSLVSEFHKQPQSL